MHLDSPQPRPLMLGLAPLGRSRWGRAHLRVCREVPESGTSLAGTRGGASEVPPLPPVTRRRGQADAFGDPSLGAPPLPLPARWRLPPST